MRRSTRKSSVVALSLDSALDANAAVKGMSTRRSSILPSLEDSRILAGNFTTKFSMSSFIKRVEELTHDQRTAIEKVGFGNLLRIHQHTLRKNLLVEWMDRWDCEKQAFVLLGRELTIAPVDAALILGLRVIGAPVTLNEDEQLSDLEEEYGATRGNRKISVSAIERRLDSLGDSADDDFVRTFLLFTFGTLLFPNSTGKIDSRYVSFLEDLDKVGEYAWGIAVIEDLFSWLSRRIEEQSKSIEGCLLLLQIWSYEHVDIGRPNSLDSTSGFPRASCWESSRCTSQRHWFSTKFNELEESEVTWKMEPRTTELDVDIIKELLEGETEAKEFCAFQHSSPPAAHDSLATTATKITSARYPRLPPKSSRQIASLNEGPNRDVEKSKQYVQDEISENSRLSTSMSEISVEYPECSSSFNMENILDDQSVAMESLHIKEDYHMLKTENSRLQDANSQLKREVTLLRNQLSEAPKLENEITLLRDQLSELPKLEEEITMLRSQLSEVPKLEDEIAWLTQEVAELKETQHLSSQSEIISNLQRLISEYYDEDPVSD